MDELRGPSGLGKAALLESDTILLLALVCLKYFKTDIAIFTETLFNSHILMFFLT